MYIPRRGLSPRCCPSLEFALVTRSCVGAAACASERYEHNKTRRRRCTVFGAQRFVISGDNYLRRTYNTTSAGTNTSSVSITLFVQRTPQYDLLEFSSLAVPDNIIINTHTYCINLPVFIHRLYVHKVHLGPNCCAL